MAMSEMAVSEDVEELLPHSWARRCMVTMAWLSYEHLGRPWAEARRWVVVIAKLSCEHQGRKSTLSWQSDTNCFYSRAHVSAE
jgi:hypothetical protein